MSIQNFDAQAALGFVLSQTTHIENEVNEVVYGDIQYQDLIPVDTSAHELAKSVTYFSEDKYGKADWINGNSDDVPVAGTEKTKFETSVHTAAIGYSYGWEEVMQAQMLGTSLKNDDAMAARRAYEEMVDEVALMGDTGKGFEGLFNSTLPDVDTAAGAWDSISDQEILKSVNDAITGINVATNNTSLSDTLILPYVQYNQIASQAFGDNADKTVLRFLKENNVYTARTGQPLEILAKRELDTIGTGGTGRMIAYRKSPEVLKLHIPMPHRFMTAQYSGLNYIVNGVFRLGGLDIRRPAEVRYVDGI